MICLCGYLFMWLFVCGAICLWGLEFGIWNLGFGIWNLEFVDLVIWDLEFGIWNLGFEI